MTPVHWLTVVLAVIYASMSGAAVPEQPQGLILAHDERQKVTLRLIEDEDTVTFELTGPTFILPQISIDADRNGGIDSDVDFSVSVLPDGSPCLTRLLREGVTSPCRPLESNAKITKRTDGEVAVTSILFPKTTVSSDGFGFGFAVGTWDEKMKFRETRASGDYRFGGFLNLVKEGPNFTGGGIPVPAEVMPSIQKYQACLTRATDLLVPLDRSKLAGLRAVPSGCAGERVLAVKEAVAALIAAKGEKSEAAAAVDALFKQIDQQFARLIEALEKAEN